MSRVLSIGAIREIVERSKRPSPNRQSVERPRHHPVSLERGEPYKSGRPRLAVDVCIAQRAFKLIEAAGADVVYEAATGEPDEVWFAAALRAGVHAVVSQDTDFRSLCHRADVRWLRIDAPGLRWRGQADYVVLKLRKWGWIP